MREIETTKDFIERVEGYWNRQYTDYQREEVKEWIDRRLKTNLQRHNLFSDLKNNYGDDKRYLPLCKDFEKYYSTGAETAVQSYKPTNGIGMDAAAIYNHLTGIRADMIQGKTISNADGDFMATWGILEYYWEELMDEGKDPFRVCEKVRIMIENGEKVPRVSAREKTNVEAYIMAAFKSQIVNSDRSRRTA